MALIICSECGKRFSDKASACPECGCPTSEITNNIKTDVETQKTSNTVVNNNVENDTVTNDTVVRVLTNAEKEDLYNHAINCAKEGTITAYQFSIDKLKELGSYKDSAEKIKYYEQQIENVKENKKNSKYAIIAIIVLAIVAVIIIFSFKGCSSNDNDGLAYRGTTISSSFEAINAVKNYNSGTTYSTDQLIASELGFNNFYPPKYGTSEAVENDDGTWDVEIHGNMSGYVDDYVDEFENYKFTLKATINSNGRITISVFKEY